MRFCIGALEDDFERKSLTFFKMEGWGEVRWWEEMREGE